MSTSCSWVVCSVGWTVISLTGLVGSGAFIIVDFSLVGLGFEVDFTSVIYGIVIAENVIFLVFSLLETAIEVVDFSVVDGADVVSLRWSFFNDFCSLRR